MTAAAWLAAGLTALAVVLVPVGPVTQVRVRALGAIAESRPQHCPPRADRDRAGGGRPGALSAVVLAGCVALGSWALVGGWVGVPFAAATAVGSWRVLARREPPAVRRQRAALERSVPQLVHLMAACLSAGSAPESALAVLSEVVDQPMRAELTPVVARLRLGADPRAVWAELARHPQLGPLGRCLLRASEGGVAVATALEELSGELRQRSRAEVEARARAVGVKAAAPLGLCLLPAFVLLGIVPLIAGLLPVLLGR